MKTKKINQICADTNLTRSELKKIIEKTNTAGPVNPEYLSLTDWEFYGSMLKIEYEQCVDEGLEIEEYKDLFDAVHKLPKNEIKKRFADIIFDIVRGAKVKKDYPYVEPSDLESIKALRKPYSYEKKVGAAIEERVHGAWQGRVCGCMLGKTVEGVRRDKLVPFLKETGNYPMHRYILESDMTEEIKAKYDTNPWYADTIDGMPVDDDTNYTVLYQQIINAYGRTFSPWDVSRAWIQFQQKGAYCTAERKAFCNFIEGYCPPESATYQNAFREWIGAQIRADYFGYINPGDPETAAEMAWRDASISHVKNGIYGEMFAAAMIAVSAETDDVADIIRAGLAEIPCTSRLYEDVTSVLEGFENGVTEEECFNNIHGKYDEHTEHGWCHTIPNAMIVAAALLYGNGDFGRSICISVENGFDTDCNGATVGSILGMAKGVGAIDKCWTDPIGDKLNTSIFGVGTVKISDRAKMTMEHINGK
ncbi:MAG: ADP-ribosylglycohydrolase family protein [Ruminococcaceae bacterium]|nr:ADP-ribosylglycohydrolase family protein [Oscillospiraceae bacterium]